MATLNTVQSWLEWAQMPPGRLPNAAGCLGMGLDKHPRVWAAATQQEVDEEIATWRTGERAAQSIGIRGKCRLACTAENKACAGPAPPPAPSFRATLEQRRSSAGAAGAAPEQRQSSARDAPEHGPSVVTTVYVVAPAVP